MHTIRKRDGRQVPFDAGKITRAILAAGKATGEFDAPTAQELTRSVLSILKDRLHGKEPTVEFVQDVVEEVLLQSPYRKTAKAYILYRDQHAKLRNLVAASQVDLVDQYLSTQDWRVNENSNMGFSLQGLNNFLASEVSQNYWLHKIYPPEVREAHLGGDFHLHDLGQLSVYCVGWDLADLLREGFRGAAGKVESRPARHFRTALGQIVNFFYTLQGEAAGAQAFSNFDTLLAPFIRYDGLSYKEVKQALQEFVFNVNVPTRVGFQTPFTNITLDWKVPTHLANEAVIWNGELQKETYGEFQEEMRMFNRAFLEVMSEGDARGRVFTFPIPTINIGKDFDWDDPDLALLWKVTGRYGVFYFANFVHSEMDPSEARSMCCRLRLDLRSLARRGGGLFGANPLTGSIGVVTLNLPRLGFLSKSEKEFMGRLDALADLAKESLEIKRKVLERFTEGGLYPYIRFYLRDIKAKTGCYWSNHFSTIGILGLNEACENLLHCGIIHSEGKAFALRVLKRLRDRLAEYQEETGHLYNLEATPAEGTTYRLAKLDQKRFAGIRFANALEVETQKAEPFYTNSSHLPVYATDDVFELLEHQDELQIQYTGGTVAHLFLGEEVTDAQAVGRFVRKVSENYRLPYFTLTPTFSVCPSHGYLKGKQPTCAECGAETEVYSRVVGYLRPVKQWNNGKKEEFRLRKTYQVAAGDRQAPPVAKG